jgi:hypothetical protein
VNRTLGVSLALAISILFLTSMTTWKSKNGVRTVYAQSGCSNATLNSKYAFTDSGFEKNQPSEKESQIPIAVVGLLSFDGAGNASLTFTIAFDGGITEGLVDTGTYTVNSNCSGSISFAGDIPINFDMVVIGTGGREIFGLPTSPVGLTQTFDAKKL